MPRAVCPKCDEKIHIPLGVDLGDEVVCEECEESLEVVGLDPLELDPVIDEGQDDDDDGIDDDLS